MVIWSFSTMHSAFLIQNDWMPRSVCDASWIAWRHASSKLFGDWAITSMLRTIDIAVSSSGGSWPQLPPVSIPYAVFGASWPGPAQWAQYSIALGHLALSRRNYTSRADLRAARAQLPPQMASCGIHCPRSKVARTQAHPTTVLLVPGCRIPLP